MVILQQLLKNQLVRYSLVLLIGVGLGAVLYPTSRIEERIKKSTQEEYSKLLEEQASDTYKALDLYESTAKSYSEYKQETEKKVQKLTTEIHNLQSKQKTSYYKLIKPDGTIEVKRYSESEVTESSSVVTQIQEEFKTKIESIETKWLTIHKQRLEEVKKDFTSKEVVYQKKIEELEKTKVTEINKKSFGVEGGYNTERQYYLHATGDLFGPLFLGIQTETDKNFDSKSIGAGLGVRF